MNEEKEVKLGYKVSKIHTTKFSFEDVSEEELNELFIGQGKMGIEVKVDMSISKENSTVLFDIYSKLYKATDNTALIEHIGRTVYLVDGLDNIYDNQKKNYNLPDGFIIQLYSIAYTHSRALLAQELSPTIYRDRYFLPVIDPVNIINQLKPVSKVK